MGNSWGHTVRLATDDELKRAKTCRADCEARCRNIAYCYGTCQTRNCTGEVTHYVGYKYVTGRAGRTSSAEKRSCETHAKKFADKHGIEMPTVAEPRYTRTGYMAVSEAIEQVVPAPGEEIFHAGKDEATAKAEYDRAKDLITDAPA